jgi:hypothetical protein
MGNNGFRISQDGNDVKTCPDIRTVVNSKFANLKGVLAGTAVATKTGDYQAKTLIAHNLEYPPIVQVYLYVGSNKWLPLPVPVPFTCSHYSDSNNVYIYFGTGMTNQAYTFKYYIYLDKAKV